MKFYRLDIRDYAGKCISLLNTEEHEKKPKKRTKKVLGGTHTTEFFKNKTVARNKAKGKIFDKTKD